MKDTERNLITFRNLCVIAHADGALGEAEIRFLEESAEAMGLNWEEVQTLVQQGPDLDFSIPSTEADCYLELRMVVLMMLADGDLAPQEYARCRQLAERMGIDETYLKEVISVYQAKREEQLKNLGIFQNLYLVAAANGHISPEEEEFLLEVAHNLGLHQDEVDDLMARYPDLDFIIPEDREEAFFSLKNLVYMMIVDGEIDAQEYALCLRFARRIGLGETEIEGILNEYEDLRKERKAHQSEVDYYNLDIYLDVFNAVRKLDVSMADLLRQVEQVARDYSPHALHLGPDAFCDLLWLAYVRAPLINHEVAVLLPVYIDLVRISNNPKPLIDFLIENEQEHGATPIALPELPRKQICEEVLEVLRQKPW
ncbi:MAG: hypothetical protein D6722_16255 [Bacteroidetes bacterium]|nr:MAG: hypothetical protein D6722_16255 [Bacteroidota bacterium]